MKKILLIGLDPETVDYSKWPDLSPEKLHATLENDKNKLNDLGYDAELFFIDNPNTIIVKLAKLLLSKEYNCILIGAGVRKDNDNMLLFEKLINAIHKSAPSANICFNSNPYDTADAVKRWV